MWTPCVYCSGCGDQASLSGARVVCWKCNGIGGYDDGNDPVAAGGGTARRAHSTPESRDRNFANLIGLAIGAWLLWIGYTRGFGGDRVWDFVIPLAAAGVVSKLLAILTIVIRPLRWAATAAIWVAILGFAAFLIQGA